MDNSVVREALARYVVGASSLAQLELTLPDGWELDERDDPDLRELTLRVVGLIGELDRGDITERTLRRRMVPLVGSVTTTSYSASPTSTLTNPQPARAFVAGSALPVGSG
jgi:hypothetical protein